MKNGAFIETADLVKSFIVGDLMVDAVRNVSVSLYPGELTLLMGPSGSGKSTLAAILGGLLTPSSGALRAMNNDLTRLSPTQLDRFRLLHCGFIFQKVNLFPSLTALNQIVFALKFVGKTGATANKAARQALDEVNMLEKANLKPKQMSGGENQRVAIARTLAMDPKMIFADEPTSALDSANGQIVVDLLHRAAKSHGAMVLCVTHDERLRAHADRILRMEDGRLLSDRRTTNGGASDED